MRWIRTPDADTDLDAVLDCEDACPTDGGKVAPGTCGCGTPDADGDADGLLDCEDDCPDTVAGAAVDEAGCALPAAGASGCGCRAGNATPLSVSLLLALLARVPRRRR